MVGVEKAEAPEEEDEVVGWREEDGGRGSEWEEDEDEAGAEVLAAK